MQGDGTVATVGVGSRVCGSVGRSSIGRSVPGICVASGDVLGGSCAVVDS